MNTEIAYMCAPRLSPFDCTQKSNADTPERVILNTRNMIDETGKRMVVTAKIFEFLTVMHEH